MMSTPYYHTPERRAALVAAAKSWRDTPFRENGRTRGAQGGVDCVHFLSGVHAEAGACEPIVLPDLPVEQVRRWHEHNKESKILEWFARPEIRGRVRRLDENEPRMTGDMVVLKTALTEHHIALWAQPDLFHVAIPAGVISHSTRDPEILRRIRCTYRIYEP